MLNMLRLPETKNLASLDDVSTTLLHAQILNRKKFLKRLYEDFYCDFAKRVPQDHGRVLVEIGSGGGFIKQVIPDVITSDVLALPSVDRVFSATAMPFEPDSIDAFFMINVLHHIAQPRFFFREGLRCLKIGGRIIMIEPANTSWARLIYTKFHHENFDPAAEWELDTAAPLSCANGAMAWIIFQRDRAIFEHEFGRFEIRHITNHTPLRYLLSGGFTLRQLVPACSHGIIKQLEKALMQKYWGMFQTIELVKIT